MIEMIEQRLRLDSEKGKLFWIKSAKQHPDLIGKEAGCLAKGRKNKNYWVIQVDGKKYKRSHIIFYLANGYWAKPCIDHINGDSTDDRPTNLRQATFTQNAWNHKYRKRRIDLPMGVRVNCSGTFSARISYKGKQIHLGVFDTPQDASNIYQIKRKELYGQFA
jgi:hypothetical protein